MKPRLAIVLLALQLVALLVGTQMPNLWREGVLQAARAPAFMSSLAHFVVFAGMAMVLTARPLAWPFVRIALAALALALLSEGLQYFAIDRHPRWLDVGIDMSGALLGWGLITLGALCVTRR